MPEYKAPGVFVEEVSYRTKTIEGVSTNIAGFVGPARYGPLDLSPEFIISLVEFEQVYGGGERLEFSNGSSIQENFLWHAVRAFFEEGGTRLYISRIYKPDAATGQVPFPGHAVGGLPGVSPVVQIRARYPGCAGNLRVTFTLKLGENVLFRNGSDATNYVQSLRQRDIVLVRKGGGAPGGSPSGDAFYIVLPDGTSPGTWLFSPSDNPLDGSNVRLQDLNPSAGHEIRIVTVTVTVDLLGQGGQLCVESDLPLDPTHQNASQPDSVFERFKPTQASPTGERQLPIVLTVGGGASGLTVLQALFHSYPGGAQGQSPPDPGLAANLANPGSDPSRRQVVVALQGGNDGTRPDATTYAGAQDSVTGKGTGLTQFENLEDISIVAAPGSTFGYADPAYSPQACGILDLLVGHAQRKRYRIAVLDCGENQTIADVRALRGRFNSSYAALYYPWIKVIDPRTKQVISLPPSGFVAGIYARNDINRAVYKAPANEVVNLAVGFEQLLTKDQQEVLNPEGINCFRFFEGRGYRLWGARTVSSDPVWKYVNLRRYFAYLERSIDQGTQWAVFEPNGEPLWSKVRIAIDNFLYTEWQGGALLGDTPAKAYFVKCDRTTMTQIDLDHGRIIFLVGVAAVRPAEFIVFRIGQWTADGKA